MSDRVYNVLFIGTGNWARSILAEALLDEMGGRRFCAYSAGSRPKGEVHPAALMELRRLHIPTDGLRSKSWDEFAQPGAPAMDFVFTMCDAAGGEISPLWSGHPMMAYWDLPDPTVEQSEEAIAHAFRSTAVAIRRRLELMLSLSLDSLDQLAVRS